VRLHTDLSSNDYLRMAGIFHGVYAIASKLSPMSEKSSGILELESETIKLRCFQTVTGTKFLVIADPKQQNLDLFLSEVYELYADFVLKNPFYELEQPVHNNCDKFHFNLEAKVEQINTKSVS